MVQKLMPTTDEISKLPTSCQPWLTTTNLTTPPADWTVGGSGALDGTGSFSNSIPVNAPAPPTFFRLRIP